MSAVVDPVTTGGVAELRQRLRDGKAQLLDHFAKARVSTPAASRLIKGLARHVDRTLQALWERAGLPEDAALVAVGGYGRGELFPHSDVDVLVLLPGDAPVADALRGPIEAFITLCWDVGLEIGSSVRNVSECVAEAQRDVTVQTAMLESRLVTGSKKLFQQFRRATNAGGGGLPADSVSTS